jgi:tetratricopeptide (TPR) repeat protein
MHHPYRSGRFAAGAMILVLLRCLAGLGAPRQEPELQPVVQSPLIERAAGLPLNQTVRASLMKDVRERKYPKAERILIHAIATNPKSPELLTFLGGVYFLDGSYLECAVAMKKAEALAPLPDPDRFTLAMAYIVLHHSDWAQPELDRLSRHDPQNPLYFYWLSRTDYDRKLYADAVLQAQKAIHVDSQFMRAYDDLGLCYEGLGKYTEAIESYRRAVRLNRQSRSPSPWPPLDFGALLVRLNRLDEGAAYLQEALRYDPRFPQAHFQLGVLLEKKGHLEQAIQQLQEAGVLNPSYAEPHYLLGRVYEQMGKPQAAQAEFAVFNKLKQADQPRPLE